MSLFHPHKITDDNTDEVSNQIVKKAIQIILHDVRLNKNFNQTIQDIREHTNIDKCSASQHLKIQKSINQKFSQIHENLSNENSKLSNPMFQVNKTIGSSKQSLGDEAKSSAPLKKLKVAKKYHMNVMDLIDTHGSGIKELDHMIGLKSVKEQMHKYIIQAMITKRAQNLGQPSNMKSLNMIFMGSPGTGKTVVARLASKILFQNGVIKKPLLKECSSKDLISPLVGGTSVKTFKVVKEALGGVLFIDEAYNLTPSNNSGDNSDASKKAAISELLRMAENHRDNLVIILAGYEDKMKALMQRGNPGLKSRFNHKIVFPDYTDDEMAQIFDYHAKKAFCVYDNKEVGDAIHNRIKDFNNFAKEQKDDSNGRLMRNLLEKIMECRDYRNGQNLHKIKHLNLKQIDTITADDVKNGYKEAYADEKNS